MPTRIAVIGHFVASPTAVRAPGTAKQLSAALRLYNYTRVLTDDFRLVDHVAYLKETLGIPREERFSVWEMNLCAGLLLRSHLARHGFDVALVNAIESDNEDSELRRLQTFAPDVVVLSTTFVLSAKQLVDAGRRLREHLPDAFLVAGGHHVFTALMYMTDDRQCAYLRQSRFDAFVNDVQGERTLLALARAWPDRLTEVPNLIWRRPDGEVVVNAREVEDNDINSTPIDFDVVPPGAVVHVRTARSCSFKCAFCSYPTIAGDLALMDLDNVAATLRRAKDAGVQAIIFVDDTFNVPRPRFEKMLERIIAAGVDLPWYSFLRCQFIDEKLVARMRRSGCQGVFLGIESGSDPVLKNMNKGGATRSYRPGITWLRDHGILTVGAFVIGFPGETPTTVAETAEFIENAGLDFYFMQPFYYLHHTPVHTVAGRYQLRGKGLAWSHATMNAEEAGAWLDRLFLDINGPTFVNPDYTLWEVAYLRSKSLDLPRIVAYRDMINRMTAAQMKTHGAPAGGVTSRAV